MFYLIIWRILFPDLLQYLIPWARVGEATPVANDRKKSGELWTWLEEQVKDIWSVFFFIILFHLRATSLISLSTRTFSVCGCTTIVYLPAWYNTLTTVSESRLSSAYTHQIMIVKSRDLQDWILNVYQRDAHILTVYLFSMIVIHEGSQTPNRRNMIIFKLFLDPSESNFFKKK